MKHLLALAPVGQMTPKELGEESTLEAFTTLLMTSSTFTNHRIWEAISSGAYLQRMKFGSSM